MNEIKIGDNFQKSYDNYYNVDYSEWRRLGALGKVNNIISLCSSLPQNRILEIGAGEGAILSRLSELNFGNMLYAIEISESGVNSINQKKIPRLIECELYDGYNIPYENNKFDIAILSHVIEHVEFPRQLLYEASRVAKYLFIEVPLEDTLRLPQNFMLDKIGHINFFSPKTFRLLIQSSNLQIHEQITTNLPKETYVYRSQTKGVISYYIKQLLLNILPGLATKLFTYHGAIVCKKIS
jgi:ubiquinone/menaquinone biosynthesis C-methylase UbiE